MILKGGSPAIHKTGDISRDEDDYIRIHSEDDEYYIGNFEEGFGFIDVQFKKTDCRPLSKQEREQLNGKWYTISGTPLYRIYVDEEGNVIKGTVKTIKGFMKAVRDHNGNDKSSPCLYWDAEFGEDVEVGKPLVIMVRLQDEMGHMTTSPVTDVEKREDMYVIYTKNSVYFIEIA